MWKMIGDVAQHKKHVELHIISPWYLTRTMPPAGYGRTKTCEASCGCDSAVDKTRQNCGACRSLGWSAGHREDRHSHGYGQGTGRRDSFRDDGRQRNLLSGNEQDRGADAGIHSCCEAPPYLTSLFNLEKEDMCISRKSALQNARFVILMRFHRKEHK